MRRNLTGPDLTRARGATGEVRGSVGRRVRQGEDVDRPGTLADPAKPVTNRLRGDEFRPSGGLQRREAESQVRGQRGRVRAAGSMSRTVRMALAGEPVQALAVEDDVLGLLAVASGDD